VTQQPVGFIGLGIMGMSMARNLMKAGFPVVCYNRTTAKAEALAKEGAVAAGSPREVAQACPIVITMVTDSPDVEAVALGPRGILEGIQRDAVHIDMSTISPTTTRKIAERLREKGAHMLDAPVSGGSWGAQSGTLSIMVGGDEAIFQRCLAVFKGMGQNIVYVGPNGMGQVTKLVNQILVVGTMNAVAEALLFAARSGADLEKTIEAVKGGAAGSWQLQNLGPRLIKGDFAPGFMVKLQQKDLRIILDSADEMHLPLPATALVHQLFASLEAAGFGDEGTQALVKAHERLAGVEARVKG